MADTVPILKIPVDDSQFQAFLETFNKFRLDAADVPNAMADVERAIDRLPEHLRPGTDALQEAAEGAADALEDVDSLDFSPTVKRKRRSRKQGKEKSTLPVDWKTIGLGVKGVASTIYATTRTLTSWGKLTGVFAGLLGVGGLYGINALAANASQRRQQSAGLGLSTGELASFQTNYAQLGDTSGILSRLNDAETDVAKRQPLQSLGIDPRGKNSLAIFGEMLPKLKKIADQTDPRTLGPALQARGLDKVGIGVEMMRMLRSLPDEDIGAMVANASRDVGALGIPDDVAVKWQELSTALHKAEARFQTVVADELVALTPSLSHLSVTATHLIDRLLGQKELGTWLKRTNDALLHFAEDVGSDKAMTQIRDFLHHFDMAKNDFDALNSWLENHGDALKAAFSVAAGAKIGSTLGSAASVARFFGLRGGAALGPLGLVAGGLTGAMFSHSSEGMIGGAKPDTPAGFGDGDLPGVGPSFNSNPGGAQSASPAPAGSGSVDKDLSGDLSGSATYGRRGEEVADPQAFIVHHTGGRGDAQGVVNTLNGRGLGVQYVLDRDGHVFRTLPEGHRGAHILPGNVDGKQLSNANTLGMEVIAKDDSDVTPAQIEAARKFYADLHKRYPHIEAYGHGYVNPGHKQATEGKTITDAIRGDEKSAAQGPAQDGVAAAKEAAAGTPLKNRGFMRGYAGRDDVPTEMRSRAGHRSLVRSYLSGHPDARPKPPQTVVVTDNSGGSSTVTVAH